MLRSSRLTSEAKSLLSSTIRALRERLLRDLHDAVESEYRLSVSVENARLPEAQRIRRQRMEAWLDERARATIPKDLKGKEAAHARFRLQAEKEAAATLLNRLVVLRHLETLGLSKPVVVTGGWNSKGYREYREFAPGLLDDPTEGYGTLLRLVFDEWAQDLPGLFGDVGLTRLIPIPASTLREVVERLDDARLESAWGDDTTLGWVYQYWNDPEREALDAKINDGGKIEPHEIASKTQMFTERYMVEWLLHNSLNVQWICICKKNGWRPDAEDVLPGLEARRAEWRGKRERGEVALDELMPVAEGLEDRWKYYVPQPIPDEAVTAAPDSIRELKLLDPACGSGHFLVIAFDLLAAMYREETRHRGLDWGDREIAEWIVERNLHGVDIDPRAVQIAAAAVFLKMKAMAPDSWPAAMNLVAPALHLADLSADDPALCALKREVEVETGIPVDLTDRLVRGLAGADHLGTLLKVDAAVSNVIHEADADLFRGAGGQLAIRFDAAKANLIERLERFLARHAGEGDLGVRLDGEELAAGIRFVRIVCEDCYDLVVGNPPYQAMSRTVDTTYLAEHYPRSSSDLYSAFLERGLELARPGGASALLTMRGWMSSSQFEHLRQHLLRSFDLRAVGDFAIGAFDEVPNDLLSVAICLFRKVPPSGERAVAVQPSPLGDKSYDRQRTNRKRAATLIQVGRREFNPQSFSHVDGNPIVYWWSEDFISAYASSQKLGAHSVIREGLGTKNDPRYLRYCWEVDRSDVMAERFPYSGGWTGHRWVPFIKGAAGVGWIQALEEVVDWHMAGLLIATYGKSRFGRGASLYFRQGVAFTTKGNTFGGRLFRFASIFGHAGSSVFGDDPGAVVCLLNKSHSRFVLESLSPGIGFQITDVRRLPLTPVASEQEVVHCLEAAFSAHEQGRETSVEFRAPAPSAWEYTQDWAQRAIDRSPDEGLPSYLPSFKMPRPEAYVSFAIGLALGRFGADCDSVDATPAGALPAGILYLSNATELDSLNHPGCAVLHAAWTKHGPAIKPKEDLRTYLRTSFFAFHKAMYENRPIYFPLSSAKRNFVAWISIHRWFDNTLQTLLADHLKPELTRLEGELEDLRKARAGGEKAKAEKRYAEVQKLHEELTAFIDTVAACAEKGPPPSDSQTTPRERDASFVMDLDDGVMINSAALWPLLEPQWKDPKKWWKELANAQGRKDYDWAHPAARYFPSRVDAKCQEDPSLAVAHHCFWKYHPAKAYAWELRLQDEIRPDFTIDEPGSDESRARFLAGHPAEAAEIQAKETKRRERKNLLDLQMAGEDEDGPAEDSGDEDADA